MSTLLIRLAAPLQAWGVESKFTTRDTQRNPTKSGVIGLVAAALGRRRTESVDDLQALRFGVRVDREGTLLTDLHMAHEAPFWEGGDAKYSHYTMRYYLADAVFLVGLEGDDSLLAAIENALRSPAFPLFLGRRSCPPSGRIVVGVCHGENLREALSKAPWQITPGTGGRTAPPSRLRMLLDVEAGDGDSYLVRDTPISFSQQQRKHGFREVNEQIVLLPASHAVDHTLHDPMMELEG